MKHLLLLAFLLGIIFLNYSEGLLGFSNNFGYNLHRDPFPTHSRLNVNVTENWIEQKLDNFNPSESRTYQMRYLENREHFQPGGPIFIYVGGEWAISPGAITGGHLYDMAAEMNGILFYTEHRYYGKSYPTADTSFENLQWHSVDQALADLAHFVRTIKANTSGLENSGVIMLGGSYSATMVTWFRLKYPELVNGVWASSAPLDAKIDFFEYKEVMGESLKKIGGQECYDVFKKAYSQIEQLIDVGKPERIEYEFNLCYPLDVNNKLDIWNLFYELSENVANLMQYATVSSVSIACETLLNDKYRDALEAYGEWTRFRLKTDCFNHTYSDFVESFSQTAWDAEFPSQSSLVGRLWTYQTCSEVGWFQTSNSKNQPFGSSFPLELFFQMCSDYLHESFTPQQIEANTRRINLLYGGYLPNVTNVYFTQGELDPWKPMGREVDLNEHAPAFVIPLIAHVADTGSISTSDFPQLVESKRRVTRLVKQWLGYEY